MRTDKRRAAANQRCAAIFTSYLGLGRGQGSSGVSAPGGATLVVDGFSARDAIHNKNIASIYIKYFISLNRAKR